MSLWPLAVVVLIANLPFGYWRANVGRFSPQWFLAIHLPVPLVIALRVFTGLGWQLATFAALVAFFFAGQLLGIRLHRWWGRRAGMRPTSCLVMDLMRGFRAGRQGACQ